MLLESLLDLGLVGLDVDNEDKGVVLLHLLHGALGVERLDDNLVLIETGQVRDRLAGVLGSTRGDEGLGAVERGAQADLAFLAGAGALESSLGGSVGLLQALGGGFLALCTSLPAILTDVKHGWLRWCYVLVVPM